ncbi:MAG: serine protease [Planctomycetota bacterium]
MRALTLLVFLTALAGCKTSVEQQRESFAGHEGTKIGGVGVEEYFRVRKVRIEAGALITAARRGEDGTIGFTYLFRPDPSRSSGNSFQFSMPAIGHCLAIPLEQPGLFLTAGHATSLRPINLIYEAGPEVRFAEAHVVWVDEEIDLALLQADLGTLPCFPLAPEITDDAAVFAGCAAGPSAGTIRSHDPEESGGGKPLPFLEVMHDAPMRDGDSGAPLIDAEGRLVGVHSSTGLRLAGLRKSRRAFLPAARTLEAMLAQAPNAAVEYERMFALLAKAADAGREVREEAYPLVGNDKPYDPERWGRSVAIVGEILQGMDGASSIGFCRFSPPRDAPNERPWLGEARNLARVNMVWTWHRVVTGKFEKAMAGWWRGFALARHIAQDGDLVDGLVGIAIASIQIDTMRRALLEDRLDLHQLGDLSEFLQEQPYGVLSLRPAFRGERLNMARLGDQWMASSDPLVACDEYFRGMRIEPDYRPETALDRMSPRQRQLTLHGLPAGMKDDIAATRDVVRKEIDDLLDRIAAAEGPATLPWDEAREAMRSALEVDAPAGSPENLLARILCPALLASMKSRMKCESRLRGVIGMISLRQSMKQFNRVPAPDKTRLPHDTCTGEKMTLEVTDSELVFRCNLEENDPEGQRRDPFYNGVYRLPIPETLRKK